MGKALPGPQLRRMADVCGKAGAGDIHPRGYTSGGTGRVQQSATDVKRNEFRLAHCSDGEYCFGQSKQRFCHR